jgi:hypothetical protein
MRSWRAGLPVAAVAAFVGSGIAGCSSGDPEPSAATASAEPTADVCSSADAFRASLRSLGDVDLVAGGTDALTSAWDDVQAGWAEFADDARAEFTDQVDVVQDDADAVRAAVDTVQQGASAGAVADAATAVQAFLTDADALVEEVSATC